MYAIVHFANDNYSWVNGIKRDMPIIYNADDRQFTRIYTISG